MPVMALRNIKKASSSDNIQSVSEVRAEKYNKYKISQSRKKWFWRSLSTAVVLSTTGAVYAYRDTIFHNLQPYWNNRREYYEAISQTLVQWERSLSEFFKWLSTTVSPYWQSAKRTGNEWLERYYWSRDLSQCGNTAKVIIHADQDGSYRTRATIANQNRRSCGYRCQCYFNECQHRQKTRVYTLCSGGNKNDLSYGFP